jgi:beta-xylosidase
MVGEEGSGGMRTITLEAATPESGRALYRAVSSFHPEFDTDDEGKCFVSVSVSSQKETLGVLDTIQQHLVGRADPITSWVTTTTRANPFPQSRGNGGSP